MDDPFGIGEKTSADAGLPVLPDYEKEPQRQENKVFIISRGRDGQFPAPSVLFFF